jgi:hypothetical protein
MKESGQKKDVNIYEQKKLLDNEAQPEAYEREA